MFQAYGLYSHIRANRIRSVLLLIGFVALLHALLYSLLLLLNAFKVVDISLPRSSSDQSKVGVDVKMNELQPGDLVFFATGRKKKQITHVGLVTEVKSKKEVKFIHASSKIGVCEVNIYSDYYQKAYRKARRVIE